MNENQQLSINFQKANLVIFIGEVKPKFCSSKICLRLTQNAWHFGQG
jgi:hypothetical protein